MTEMIQIGSNAIPAHDGTMMSVQWTVVANASPGFLKAKSTERKIFVIFDLIFFSYEIYICCVIVFMLGYKSTVQRVS